MKNNTLLIFGVGGVPFDQESIIFLLLLTVARVTMILI